MLLNVFLMFVAVWCALQALRTKHLLSAAIWLACCSALTAVVLFILGAPEVAVIELSVGAGLVTILFVFGITIAGEDAREPGTVAPWVLAGGLALAVVGLIGWFVLPLNEVGTAVTEPSFSVMLWETRGLDMLVQIGLIFAGVLGVLGILAERESVPKRARAGQYTRPIEPALPKPQPVIIEAPTEGILQGSAGVSPARADGTSTIPFAQEVHA